MSNTHYICTSSDFSELKKIRDFVDVTAKEFEIPNDISDNMIVAVDEACTNIIKHTFNGDTSNFLCVEVGKEKDNFVVTIYDKGKPFDPDNVESLNLHNYFKEFRKSGLGIYLIRTLIDDIEYTPSDIEHPKNLLKLIKNIY